MPISIRLNVDNLFEERVIDEFYDVENVKRKLSQPSRVMTETANVSIVIFPYYNDRGINQITPINNSNFYNRILSNVRHSRDPESIFKDVSFLIKNASAYQIAYTNSEKAYKLLKTIVYNKGKI